MVTAVSCQPPRIRHASGHGGRFVAPARIRAHVSGPPWCSSGDCVGGCAGFPSVDCTCSEWCAPLTRGGGQDAGRIAAWGGRRRCRQRERVGLGTAAKRGTQDAQRQDALSLSRAHAALSPGTTVFALGPHLEACRPAGGVPVKRDGPRWEGKPAKKRVRGEHTSGET